MALAWQFCVQWIAINDLCLEWHWISRWDRWNELIEEEPLIKDGYITVSDKPGIAQFCILMVRGLPM